MIPLKSTHYIKLLTKLSSARGKGVALTVFVFHKITQEKREFYQDMPDKNTFIEQLDWITEQFNVIRLTDALAAIAKNQLRPSTACITFDDGDKETWECASETLSQQCTPATFFINTGYLESGAPNHEYIYAALENTKEKILDLRNIGQGQIPTGSQKENRLIADSLCNKAKYLNSAEADFFRKEIVTAAKADINPRTIRFADIEKNPHSYLEFGGHSHYHNILTTLSTNDAEYEIRKCRTIISELTGNSYPMFAYPNGKAKEDFSPDHELLVKKAGFSAAFSYNAGVFRKGDNKFNIPRFTAWDKTKLKFQFRMILNLAQKPAANEKPGKSQSKIIHRKLHLGS